MADEATYHFTYRSPAGELGQGDLLEKTAEVRALLEAVHPHYAKDHYTHLLVLTQSCDLVRRAGGVCGARYVSLAAVRPLSLVLERAVERHQDDFCRTAGVCGRGKQSQIKRSLEEFVERLLNNNEPEYFYLEPDVAAGISDASCAFLRLSIAVRAKDHYETLLKARRLSLTEVFQAKLGWLVGSMYSRVGTPDWVPERIPTKSQFQKKVETILGGVVQWVDDEKLEAAKVANPGLTTRAALREHIEKTGVPKRKDRVLDVVLEVLRREALLEDEKAQRFRRILWNDPALSTLLK